MENKNIPYKIFVEPLYKKDNGMYVINITGVPFVSKFKWIEKVSMLLPPSVVAGNHSHQHVEAFLAMTKGLVLYWQDNKGTVHAIQMHNKKRPFFLILPSNIPHAVKNNSIHDGVMVKFANEPPGKMKKVFLIS